MPLMRCPPGAEMQTLQGDHYRDDGSGQVPVDDRHLSEALSRGWRVIEAPELPAKIDEALDQLEAGIAAQDESVEALVEDALSQVPEERAAEARAAAHAAVAASPGAKDEKSEEAEQADESRAHEETQPRGARGDPRNYPTYRPPRR